MLLLVVLLLRRLVSGDIVLVRVRDNAKIPFFRLLGAELHLGIGGGELTVDQPENEIVVHELSRARKPKERHT